MDKIVKEIKNKLDKYELASYDELEIKTQQRLLMIEQAISTLTINLKKSINSAKESMPNITNIIKSDQVNISRKTIYNQQILKKYIELSINDLPDYFNEKKVRSLENRLDELNELYYKVIDNIIDDYNKDNQIEELKKNINMLTEENNRLRQYIYEQQKIKNNNDSKVIPMKK